MSVSPVRSGLSRYDLSVYRTISAAWEVAIEEWLRYAHTMGWASTTIRTRVDHLRVLARRLGCDPFGVEPLQLAAWFNAQRWSTETRRGHRQTLRAFYGWAAKSGRVAVSPALSLPKVRPAPPRPRPTPDDVYVRALAGARPRERLMLRLGAEIGLRRREVALVHSDDLFQDLDGWSLVVHGKGGKERVLPLPPLLAAELLALPKGYAFPGDVDGHLSPRWVGTLVSRLMPEPWTMHTLRHRFADRTHQVEHDLVIVQELLGHASIVTTRAYVPVRRDRLRATVEIAAAS